MAYTDSLIGYVTNTIPNNTIAAWSGAAWVPVQAWTGSAWVPVKVWNGTAWTPSS